MLSMPIMPNIRPSARHQQRAHQRRRRHIGEEDQAEHEQRGVFRRAESQRDGGQRRRDEGQHDDAERAGDERADRGDAERGAGAAFPAPSRCRRCRSSPTTASPGNAHQDRRGRAAVLRAVIDAGEHDDGLRGVEAERHRQKDRDAGRAARCRAARRPACRPGSRETRTRGSPAASATEKPCTRLTRVASTRLRSPTAPAGSGVLSTKSKPHR